MQHQGVVRVSSNCLGTLHKVDLGSGDTSAASVVPDIFKATEAGKARPLAAKLDVLLDLMFRKICYDPSDPSNTEWTTDRVSRVLKKQDKDLGN